LAAPARAAEVTRVVSALDDENRFDFNLTASWLHEVTSSLVKRESQSTLASDTELVKDLKFGRQRDVLNLRGDFGVLWDVGLHVELPIVLYDSDHLDFDQSGSCPPEPGDLHPSCVNQNNSTLLRDGILPGYGANSWGLDAAHNGRQFTSGSRVFQGPTRNGLESLNLGITWAPFNQMRDDTKPTWTLSFDSKLDVFKDMRFDPGSAGSNTAVGLGYHQFVWSTWVSKRFRHFDPYFGAWYMLPVRTNGSPFQSYGPTQTAVNPQQQAGFTVGVEQIAWENPAANQRVTVEARFGAQEHFFGRARSEIWEPLSGNGTCNGNGAASCRAGIDLDLDGDGVADHPHPGITDVQSYASFGGDVGLNVQVGKYARFRGLFGLATDMPHFITDADAGIDANHDGHVDASNAAEANPVYRQAIDQPGRRFRVEGSKIWTLLIEGSLMF
jgi:hypothetical protein